MERHRPNRSRRRVKPALASTVAPLVWLLAGSCAPDPAPDPRPFLPEPVEDVGHRDLAWSPDGEWIAFTEHSSESGVNIWRVRPDGSDRRLVAEKAAFVTWSPEGTRLAFSASRGGAWAIYAADVDGGPLTRITPAGEADYTTPAWSPLGETLAFCSNREGSYDIYTVALDGTGLTRLTSAPVSDLAPAWSSDGKRLVFSRPRSDGTHRIWQIGADGSNEREITMIDEVWDYSPSYRSDGSVVFSRNDLSHGAVRGQTVVIRPDGVWETLLRVRGGVESVRWSPDGRQIAFIAGRSTNTAIYVADAYGRDIRKIVN